jgi:hypothetical protein
MRAVVTQGTGNANLPHPEKAERPDPDDGEMLVTVRAAADSADGRLDRSSTDEQNDLAADMTGRAQLMRVADSVQ